MQGSNKTIREIGECLCLESPYKHFIMASLEESIQNREKEIYIIKKAGKEITTINDIAGSKQTDAMIDLYRSTKEELVKIRNMVYNIVGCPPL